MPFALELEVKFGPRDRAAYRFTFRGTHKRVLMGFRATGNTGYVERTSTLRMAVGKIVEHFGHWGAVGYSKASVQG